MPIKLISGAGGSLTVTPASTASNYTLTVPAVTANVVTTGDSNTITQTMINQSSFFGGYGPAFSVLLSGNQSITSTTYTKLQHGTKEFDTANCFDNTTNYRFTPNVAGYYQIFASVFPSTNVTQVNSVIYKNGSMYKGNAMTFSSGQLPVNTSVLVYLNGSTDYIEHYGYLVGTTPSISNNSAFTWFQGTLVRAA